MELSDSMSGRDEAEPEKLSEYAPSGVAQVHEEQKRCRA